MEINYEVEKQEDGSYLATADLEDGGSIIVDDEDYLSLKQKIKRMTSHHLDVKRKRGLDAPKNPQIRLVYSESLFDNPGADEIVITGSYDGDNYRAVCNGYVNIDLRRQDLDGLKELVSQRLMDDGHDKSHVEFRLEEVL